ncbi:MAG: peptidylprolyl isomerase [Chloroflexota bacterium]
MAKRSMERRTQRGRERAGSPLDVSRRNLSRRQQTERMRRIAIIGTVVAGALVVLVLAWGLFDQYVRLPRRPVATVAGNVIRLQEYRDLLGYRRWDYRNYLARLEDQRRQYAAGGEAQSFMVQYMDQQISQVQSELATLPSSVLDELIDNQLVRAEAQRRSLTVSADEVQIQLEEQFGYLRNPPTPTPVPITHTLPVTVTPTPTVAPMTLQEFEERSKEWLQVVGQSTGLSEQRFRQLIENSLCREKVTEALKAEAPATAEQVHARHILVETREEADAALARLKAGEAFDALAAELSTDTGSKESGGDLGWFARGQMVAPFDEAAFALEAGKVSEVVETDFGFHIIQVLERDANRALEGEALAAAQDEYVSNWFTELRASPDVARSFESWTVPTETPTRLPSRR